VSNRPGREGAELLGEEVLLGKEGIGSSRGGEGDFPLSDEEVSCALGKLWTKATVMLAKLVGESECLRLCVGDCKGLLVLRSFKDEESMFNGLN